MAVRNFDKTKVAEHDAFYARLFSDVFMKANSEEKNPLTAVCIWGLVDAPEFLKGNYVYNLNSPYGCLLTTDYKIKTCFDAVYHTLKGDMMNSNSQFIIHMIVSRLNHLILHSEF